jgi:hypothetical protein
MKKTLNIFLLLTVAVFSLWCTGGLMRKNDQATILAGAHDLAQGRMQEPSVYYQYDKTYVLYWVCAAVFKLTPGVSPIAAGNISLAVIFWSALAVFVVRFRCKLDPLVLLCFLTAPAVFLNTPYVNSSVLSSAFLLASAALLLQEKRPGGWPAALFFFLAVGARADVILLLPLLFWLMTPLPMLGTFFAEVSRDWKNGWKGLSGFSSHWKLLLAGISALATGRLLCPGGGASMDPIFNLKMVAGYAVFGFGAAGLLFVICSVRLAVRAVKGQGAFGKLYELAGLLVFLLPVLFFIPQLHAPRYFWRGCEAVLLLAVAGRLPVWTSRPVHTLILLTALLPMMFGVRLPELNRPRLTVSQPELFPSGDGFYPMGGSIPFMLRLRHAVEHPIDHNQRIWNAVRQADFHFDDRNSMDVLHTPMTGYFMLEASLRGGFARSHSFDRLGDRPFYADSRSLMRADPKTPIRFLDEVLTLPSRFVSPVSDGLGVLEFGSGDDRWGRQTRLLNRLFAGNEYRVFSSDQTEFPKYATVVFSTQPFAQARRDEASGLYYVTGDVPLSAAGIYRAVAVLPSWMSLGAFTGRRQ